MAHSRLRAMSSRTLLRLAELTLRYSNYWKLTDYMLAHFDKLIPDLFICNSGIFENNRTPYNHYPTVNVLTI